MKGAVGFLLLYTALAGAIESGSSVTGVFDYHLKYGVAAASRIREFESNTTPIGSRIAGGGTTSTLSVPYQVGLLITFRVVLTSVCGGCLISDTRVLTAAHCYNDGNSIASSMTAVLGSNTLVTGGTRVVSTDFVIYPGYNPIIVANDIGVLRIPAVTFSLTIQPISLPSGSELNTNYAATQATVSGYGASRGDETVGLTTTIKSVDVIVITNYACENVYGEVIIPSHLCTSGAGGVGMCTGDTGGPLVTTRNGRRILIGVASFVSSNGCETGSPSGFTRVTHFVPWIHTI